MSGREAEWREGGELSSFIECSNTPLNTLSQRACPTPEAAGPDLRRGCVTSAAVPRAKSRYRLKRFASSGAASDLGEGWKQGFGTLCYLPSPGQGDDVNPYAAARQTVEVNLRGRDPVVRVTTNLYDGPIYNHQLEATFDEEAGAFRQVEERTHFTLDDSQMLLVDGERFGWDETLKGAADDRSPRQAANSLLTGFEGGAEIHERDGFLFLPGAHLRKRNA